MCEGEGHYYLWSLHVGGIMDPGAHEPSSPTYKSNEEVPSFQLFFRATAGSIALHFKI
jgi:hypothetical protein